MLKKGQEIPSAAYIAFQTVGKMKKRFDADQFISLGLAILSLLAAYALLQQAKVEQGWFFPRRLMVAIFLVSVGLVFHLIVIILRAESRQAFLARLIGHKSIFNRRRWLAVLLMVLTLIGAAFLVYGQYGQPYLDPLVRLWVFAQSAWLVNWLFFTSALAQDKKTAAVISLLTVGLAFNVGFFLSKISTHPFSLDWSETSRYYYASLFFAERIYGVKAAWSPLHPSRYLLQSIPFLFHPLPLWLHRAWQVFLWIFIPAATSWLLLRRLKLTNFRWIGWLYGYLFLMIGAVYYHLLPIPALTLAFYRSRSATRREHLLGIAALLLASIWAGISRVNWLPMPALLLTTLYLLEQPINGQKLWRYLLPPFVLSAISILIAFLSSTDYIRLSGNPPAYFASSFTSDLIWQRLLPNPTYYSGILLPILFVSIPALFAIGYAQQRYNILLGGWRLLGLAGITLVVFTVGLIVSAKIGGGSNLHNFDGYLVVLWITLYAFLSGKVSSEVAGEKPSHQSLGRRIWIGTHNLLQRQPALVNALFAWLVIAPLPFAIFQGRPIKTYSADRVEEALATLYSVVEKAVASKKEVLFITERHLLTFGYLPNIPLVADYEKVWLMEMAMANHREYLQKFYDDLAQRRFAVIVTTQTYLSPQGDSGRFGDENRAWRKRVNRPLLCYYKPALRFREFNFEILLPREQIQRRCR